MRNIKRVILIEDDLKKKEDIKEFMDLSYSLEKLDIKESYQSGLRALIKEEYDLLLLDMSIPTWDKTINEPGGNFEKFGGYKILKEITRKNRPINSILITMFDDFGESDTSITLTQFNEMLKKEFPQIYHGAVYYNAREGQWKKDLKHIIEQITEE